jgi:hypothetical protein
LTQKLELGADRGVGVIGGESHGLAASGVHLNRAAAIEMLGGPEAGLTRIDAPRSAPTPDYDVN